MGADGADQSKPPASPSLQAVSASPDTADDHGRRSPTNGDNAAAASPATTGGPSPSPSKARKGGGAGGAASLLPKSYVELVQEGIAALKDRTGSSAVALAKHLKEAYPQLGGLTADQFKRHFNNALKVGVKNGRFLKVKSSYKISPAWREREKALKKKKQRQKEQAAAAKKKKMMAPPSLEETKRRNAEKLAALRAKMTPEELAREKEKMARQEAAQRRAAELERKAKERADRLKRRRFPMEDSRLHAEDKELNVKPPADVAARPYLPYFFSVTRPLDDASRFGKTPDRILQASKVDGLDLGSFGLVPDLLSVYHFFRGDVHFMGDDPDCPLVPEFKLSHLIFSVEQILYGHSKASRMLPPLITHLFVTSLSILCAGPSAADAADAAAGSSSSSSRAELQLKRDLHRYLKPALTPASWADICFLYMDAMERYYTTDATRDPNVLECFNTDIEYLLGVKDKPTVSMTPFIKKTSENGTGTRSAPEETTKPLPDGYRGYLGDPQSALYRAHFKLARSDPWSLTADEVMALLRALTDDILAMHPVVSRDIAAREEEMQALLKAKRAADTKFRQVRLAFEGPKKPAPKKTSTDEEKKEDEIATGEDNAGKGTKEEKAEDTFKPTATKKQFETAKKLQQKANDAYEKGIRKLVARTEPIGFDRNFNAVYCFRHDPEFLYVEDLRPPSNVATHLPLDVQIPRRSWHVIETTSLFDLFAASLDIRGRREHDLYEELIGQGPQQSLRRFIFHDDVKARENSSNLLKEKETLLQRLELVRRKCDDEKGRRSGRLAGAAEEELCEVESAIVALERRMEGKGEENLHLDYEEVTGLALLRKFDTRKGVDTRRTREKRELVESQGTLQCSNLVSTGDIDGTGLVGLIVQNLFELENLCQKLSPWEMEGVDRNSWISRLENVVFSWNESSPAVIGPPGTAQARESIGNPNDSSPFIKRGPSRDDAADTVESASKRQRLASPTAKATSSSFAMSSSSVVPSIVSTIRHALLDLEGRIADMTNSVAVARDITLADDNMSVDEADHDAQNERLDRHWKRLIYKAGQTMTKKYAVIRELVIAAIAAARRAHLPDVVARLRACLLLYHSGAAGECKTAALKVLEDYGGYDVEDDVAFDDDNDEEGEDGNEICDENADEEQEAVPSVVCAEAALLVSSLGGSEDGSRNDWIEAVKSTKTLSRLASLVAGFVNDASSKIAKMDVEHNDLLNALSKWEKEADRQPKIKTKKTSRNGPSEVWANVRITDDIVMAKAEEFPWWPAKKCVCKDPELESKLHRAGRYLVTLIGERGDLRVVTEDSISPFTGSLIEEADDVEVSKELRNQLDDCMAMARRLIRGSNRLNKKS